jgi:hypothetical protein
MLLQPPSKYRHYSQACYTHYSTEPSHDPHLHYPYIAAFLALPPYPPPPSPIYLVYPIQQVTLQATYAFF